MPRDAQQRGITFLRTYHGLPSMTNFHLDGSTYTTNAAEKRTNRTKPTRQAKKDGRLQERIC